MEKSSVIWDRRSGKSSDSPATCTDLGCTGPFSELVKVLRTTSGDAEQILLHNDVADAMRAAGACPDSANTVIEVLETAGMDTLRDKLHLALALDNKVYLRVRPSGDGSSCELSYLNLYP